jgi:hypothetical protein
MPTNHSSRTCLWGTYTWGNGLYTSALEVILHIYGVIQIVIHSNDNNQMEENSKTENVKAENRSPLASIEGGQRMEKSKCLKRNFHIMLVTLY